MSGSGELTWIDSRGERDIALPPPFDFEWTRATRDLMVAGRHPHLNILDTLFVETTGGDLTIKVENNTGTGQGVYSEPVEDSTQSLDDATIDYTRVGSLVLLKILPYREQQWRGLIFNTVTGAVVRNDAIVQACVQLPEDHGIIFPGGYYLQNGEHKAFDAAMQGMQYKRTLRSPNGEDVLYVFYEREAGRSALFVYNTIRRELQNPLFGHGYAFLQDGRMVLFHAEGDAPTRIHPMQVWQTPFTSDEFAARVPAGTGFMGRIGNAALVRGISDLLELGRGIDSPQVSAQRYQLLVHGTRRMFDAHHWLDDANCDGVSSLLHALSATGESVLDEYEKARTRRSPTRPWRARAQRVRGGCSRELDAIEESSRRWAQSLASGQLSPLRYGYSTPPPSKDGHGAAEARNGRAAIRQFLGGASAGARTSDCAAGPSAQQAERAPTRRTLSASRRCRPTACCGADGHLKVGMPPSAARGGRSRRCMARTSPARAPERRRSLGSAEAVAQFSAQFALFGQSIASALGLATDPERADEQLSRLMVQLEELESQFGEHEQFLGDILAKREELLDTFDAHRQALVDQRQRKAQSVYDAAARILDGLARRTERLATLDELNAFFAGDPLILKLRELAGRLREHRDSVKADDIEARLKGVRDQAVRSLRDRSDLFEDGGQVIRLGPRHRFSVKPSRCDLTILPRGAGLAVHLTGTDYYAATTSPNSTRCANGGRCRWVPNRPNCTGANTWPG